MPESGMVKVRSLAGARRLAIIEALTIGVVAGLAGLAVKYGVSAVGSFRLAEAARLPHMVGLPLFGLLGGLLSGWLVERVAPETTGSGIPQVKAVLNRIPMAFDLRVAAVKLVGGIIALGSGMPLGREGPTVQVGATLAAQLEKWVPTSPQHRRNLIAAGAGAGLAAAFNAPIAGVLFVAEELLKDISSFTLGTAILACFVASLIAQGGGTTAFDIRLDEGIPKATFTVAEIPFFVLLGALAGLLGALFNQGILAGLTFNFRTIKVPLTLRVGLAGLVCGGLLALLPPVFHDNAALRHLIVNAEATPDTAALAFAVQFLLTVVAYGSGAPGGLFAPTLMLGGSLGYLVGLASQDIVGHGLPTTFALAGMGAFFAGAIRVPVTAVVIVFEMTGDFNLVLPLMICVVVAWFVGERVAPGPLYDRLLAWRGINIEAKAPGGLADLTAGDVMRKEFQTLESTASLSSAVEVLAQCRGCPVIDSGEIKGVVTQADLAAILARGLTGESPVAEIMTPDAVTANPDDPAGQLLELMTTRNLSVLPVVRGAEVVGLITLNDLVDAGFKRTTESGSDQDDG